MSLPEQDGAWETTRQLIEQVRASRAGWAGYQSAEHICEALDVDPVRIGNRGYLILSEALQGGDVDHHMDVWAEALKEGVTEWT